MVVAYIKSFTKCKQSCEVQENIIKNYVKKHNLQCNQWFMDGKGKLKRPSSMTMQWRAMGYEDFQVYDRIYPEWEKMLLYILEHDVSAIVVDLACRLQMMPKQNRVFQEICERKGIQIIEASKDNPTEPVSEQGQVAIYHFTNKSEMRPIVHEKEIDALYVRVSQMKVWDAPRVFVDYSLRKSEHKEYERFRQKVSWFSTLFVTYFYHIEVRTVTFFHEIKALWRNGTTIESLNEGVLKWTDENFLNKTQRVALYDCGMDEEEQGLLIERVKAFVKFKTAWEMKDIYLEKGKTQHDLKTGVLSQLIQNANKYDAVIVRGFNCLHSRTSMFFKIMMQLGVPVYSMKEGGGLYIEKSKCE